VFGYYGYYFVDADGHQFVEYALYSGFTLYRYIFSPAMLVKFTVFQDEDGKN
jgi:hypothetical protein